MGEGDIECRLLRDPEVNRLERRKHSKRQRALKYAHTPRPMRIQKVADIRIASRNVCCHGHVRSRPVLIGACDSEEEVSFLPSARASAGRSSPVPAGSDQRGRWFIIG
jgi:hypothetical protein